MELVADVGWQQLDKRRFAVYGSACSLLLDSAVYPAEVIKTRLQTQSVSVSRTHPHYTGTLHAARSIFQLEGVTGFMKGFAPAAAFSIPSQVLYFGAYEYFRDLTRRVYGDARGDAAEVLCDFAAGGAAEVVSSVVWMPADLVSQRLMVQGPHTGGQRHANARDVVRRTLRHEGVRGLYAGLGASLCTHIPTSAVCLATYEYTKKFLYRHTRQLDERERRGTAQAVNVPVRDDGEGRHWVNVAAALVGGTVAGVVVNPLDVVRARKMAAGSVLPHHARHFGTLRLLTRIAVLEGIDGLFSGTVARVCFLAPSTALALFTYEIVKNLSLKRDE